MNGTATIIITPCDNCNLACRYCVHPHARTGNVMSESTLENALVKTAEYECRLGRGVRFIWHGGEPLLAGRDFYQTVVELTLRLRRKGFEIQHAMQTNGTLMSERIAAFLHSNGFSVSFSLDGPKHLNDRTRVYPDGTSTFDDVLNGIACMSSCGVRPSAICVVSSANIANLQEIYRFFALRGICSKFNPWFPIPGTAESLGISANEYGFVMCQLFDNWFSECQPAVWGEDNFFEHILLTLLTRRPISCVFRNCQLDEIYAIDPLGNVGPCSRFVGHPAFVFGNVNDHCTFDPIAGSPTRLQLLTRVQRVQECNGCKYRSICNSGCMHQALAAYGTVDKKDPLCLAYRRIFAHADTVLTDSLIEASARRNEQCAVEKLNTCQC